MRASIWMARYTPVNNNPPHTSATPSNSTTTTDQKLDNTYKSSDNHQMIIRPTLIKWELIDKQINQFSADSFKLCNGGPIWISHLGPTTQAYSGIQEQLSFPAILLCWLYSKNQQTKWCTQYYFFYRQYYMMVPTRVWPRFSNSNGLDAAEVCNFKLAVLWN